MLKYTVLINVTYNLYNNCCSLNVNKSYLIMHSCK